MLTRAEILGIAAVFVFIAALTAICIKYAAEEIQSCESKGGVVVKQYSGLLVCIQAEVIKQ